MTRTSTGVAALTQSGLKASWAFQLAKTKNKVRLIIFTGDDVRLMYPANIIRAVGIWYIVYP